MPASCQKEICDHLIDQRPDWLRIPHGPDGIVTVVER
jgi:hypothetical protein